MSVRAARLSRVRSISNSSGHLTSKTLVAFLHERSCLRGFCANRRKSRHPWLLRKISTHFSVEAPRHRNTLRWGTQCYFVFAISQLTIVELPSGAVFPSAFCTMSNVVLVLRFGEENDVSWAPPIPRESTGV